jgi:hypothetical protein
MQLPSGTDSLKLQQHHRHCPFQRHCHLFRACVKIETSSHVIVPIFGENLRTRGGPAAVAHRCLPNRQRQPHLQQKKLKPSLDSSSLRTSANSEFRTIGALPSARSNLLSNMVSRVFHIWWGHTVTRAQDTTGIQKQENIVLRPRGTQT